MKKQILNLASCVTVLLAATSLQAVDYTWDNGGADGQWNTTSSNWGGTWPSSGTDNDAILDGTPAGTIDVTSAVNVNGITVSGGAYTITTSTGSLDFNGSTSTVNVNAGSLTFQNVDSFDQTSNQNTLTVANGATLEFNVTSGTQVLGSQNGSGITIQGNGTWVKSGGSELQLHEGGGRDITIAMGSGGLIHIQGGQLRNGHYASQDWTGNLADLRVDGGAFYETHNGATQYFDTLLGSGTIKKATFGNTSNFQMGVDDGTGSFDGTLRNQTNGDLNMIKTGAGTQTFAGTLENTGTGTLNFDLQAGGITLSGNASQQATEFVVSGGTFTQTSTGTFQADDLFHVNGSSVTAISMADLPDTSDGSSVLKYTIDPGGSTAITLTDNNPFAQYDANAATGLGLWGNEWDVQLELTDIDNILNDFGDITLFSSTFYDTSLLNGQVDILAANGIGTPTTYEDITHGTTIYLKSGSGDIEVIASYRVNITDDPNAFFLEFTGARMIPEPSTLLLIGLGAALLRRRMLQAIQG